MSGTECLGLDQTPLLSVGGGDRLVGGLTSSDSVVDNWGMVSTEDGASGDGGCEGEEGEADKCLEQKRLSHLPHLPGENVSHVLTFMSLG